MEEDFRLSASPFSPIDQALLQWSRAKSVHVCTSYKDSEVRSFDVINGRGTRVQVWLEPRDGDLFEVIAWNYKPKKGKQTARFQEPASEITNALDSAMAALKGW